MSNIGFWDWIIIFVIVLLLFGAKRLPELARSIGRSITALKQGMKEAESDSENKKEKNPADDQLAK